MRITSLVAVLAVFAPPATTLMSAGCTCGLIELDNGLHVDIEVPAAPATYRVEVEADGELLALSYEIAEQEVRCLLGCNVTGARLTLSDSFPSDLEGLAVTIRRLDSERGPASATVRVFRGETLAAEATFEPSYETDYPNGRSCGEHVHASATLAVP